MRSVSVLRPVALALFAASCGSGPEEPAVRDIPVAYVPRLPSGCPDAMSLYFAMCAHHNAPAGLQTIVPQWGVDTVRLTETSAGRYEGVMRMVPTNTTLRL